MRVAVAADHGGFALKQRALDEVRSFGHEALDCGGRGDPGDDYPDFARSVSEMVAAGAADRAILICGSGVGASFAASKFPGIRAAVCHDTYSARQGVEHDDLNVLCLGARVVGEELAAELIRAFLAARFAGSERFVRRLAKVAEIERHYRQSQEVPHG